jgi:subtilisin-like proprotein convertase family protein
MLKKALIVFLLVFTAVCSLANFDAAKTSAQSEPTDSMQNIIRYNENFDGVSAPQVPVGWTIATTGTGVNFATVTNNFDTAPNAVFAPALATAGSSDITSPPILVAGVTNILRFRNRYSVENTWDGAVLEIKIGSGNFQDIIDAGGTFISGGYTTLLNPSPNPLANRFAWSGASSNGYISTAVQLPASAFGQFVQFRWRLGTNDSFGIDGWWFDSVTLETATTGANTNQINISSAGTASPYPSAIQISGLNGVVTDVAVGLENFSHTLPDDVDILLVSPNGRNIILMSDSGGNTTANNVNLTFTDAAAQTLPDNSALSTGLFKPTEFESPDTFPSPAPQTISGTTLSSFYGSNPNGTWSLYAVDDQGNNAGSIAGGWNLSIKTSPNACLPSVSPSAQSFSAPGGSGSFQITSPAGCDWTISTNNPFITFNSPTNGTGNSPVNYTVAPNTGAARTGLITISDGFNNRTLQIQQGSGCPTSISQESLSFAAAGGTGSVQVTASGTCNWQVSANVNWVQITSAQQSGNGTASFTIAANTSGNPRSGIINIGSKTLLINQISTISAKFDFDGDGKSDVSVFRNGNWFLQQSTNGFTSVSFGISTDKLVPADFDGDGKTDVAVFRDGNWYILQSSNNAFRAVAFGSANDVPVPNDFDGDGRAEVAVFRNGIWFTQNLSNNQFTSVAFGQADDKPVPADFDGDGRADFAVYRNGTWYLLRSQTGFTAVQFGNAGDKAVPADFDGNGQADLAVFRDGNWYRLLNLQTFSAVLFGQTNDLPVAADYDGDGKTDVAVFRGGSWYILQSSNSQFVAVQFGLANDKPIPNSFVQ